MSIIDYNFQHSAAEKVLERTLDKGFSASLLIAAPGYGKTYIVSLALRELFAREWFRDWKGVFPVLWITKATAVEQTSRVTQDEFGLEPDKVYVTNYDQFRATLGQIWVTEKSVVTIEGEVGIGYQWREGFAPKLFILDESQSLKNESQQTSIFLAAAEHPNTFFWHVSASPFDRVAAAKCFVVHSRVPYTYGFAKDAPMEEKHWPDFAREIAGGTSPMEYNKEACKRLMVYMRDYIVRVPHIETEFKCTNSVQCVPISAEKKLVYDKALTEYIEAVERILEEEPPNGVMLMLVAFLMFRKKAEILKVEELAEAAMASIKAGKAPIIGCNFKVTIARISEILVHKYGMKREDISLIWGGISRPVKGKATASSILDFQSIEDSVDDLDLGPQTREARQREIDRFQAGIAKVCLFTFKAGGVALSLHHHREDQLPREGFFATTYSAIELMQALGRDHRINNRSHTQNTIILFKETIEEEHVFPILSAKVQCLGIIVGSREKWADITLAGKDYLRDKAKDILGKEDDEFELGDGFFGDTVDLEQHQQLTLWEPKELPPAKETKLLAAPPLAKRTFLCKTVSYLPLWYKLPVKKACTPAAIDKLCARYGAEVPLESNTMTFIEKDNDGKRCLIRVDNNGNYTVAYEA